MLRKGSSQFGTIVAIVIALIIVVGLLFWIRGGDRVTPPADDEASLPDPNKNTREDIDADLDAVNVEPLDSDFQEIDENLNQL